MTLTSCPADVKKLNLHVNITQIKTFCITCLHAKQGQYYFYTSVTASTKSQDLRADSKVVCTWTQHQELPPTVSLHTTQIQWVTLHVALQPEDWANVSHINKRPHGWATPATEIAELCKDYYVILPALCSFIPSGVSRGEMRDELDTGRNQRVQANLKVFLSLLVRKSLQFITKWVEFNTESDDHHIDNIN